MTTVDRASTLFARTLCALVFGPVDRTVCRFAVVTHRGES
jgi:hypothetical protein